MECSNARHFIHLDVGNDLRAEEQLQLATHMGQCGDCRSYHAGMSSAMTMLLTLRDDPAMVADSVNTRSVWPSLSREIQRRKASPRVTRRFNLQVVALSVCSLSLAVVTMVQSLSSMREYRDPAGFVSAQTVFNHSQTPQTGMLQFRQGVNDDPNLVQSALLPHETPIWLPQSF